MELICVTENKERDVSTTVEQPCIYSFDEVSLEMDCICGSPDPVLIENTYPGICPECGRKYELTIGVKVKWVEGLPKKEQLRNTLDNHGLFDSDNQ